ncbi:NifB/NifX family molybdenum-iron cluster-binding protein [Fundidesulfovibrio putealis]|uniref:NifB/NifX family molybdenum-iron cluster-binding protein n=1 Tax=Fundidesulfovibrio putealis TaxID=270496 RepID=UPI00041F96AB|nr:NifB/NifX family molybdenum-iron cluster-binding protein [Fundidesulfovibrio putealis]
MRTLRVLIPLFKDEVAPRFDLAAEALLADVIQDGDGDVGEIKTEDFLLPHPSADGLCDLILRKDVDVLICGGIEEEYYHYLRWKRVEVLDNVAGPARDVLERYAQGALQSGDILFDREEDHAR